LFENRFQKKLPGKKKPVMGGHRFFYHNKKRGEDEKKETIKSVNYYSLN